MSSTVLDGLLPIHASRERRALRIYHEHNQAYELALAAQMNTALQITRLQHSAQSVLCRVLEGARSAPVRPRPPSNRWACSSGRSKAPT
ncbi:MAG: hypothetical protein H0U56_12090 [Methylibium sp.]|nr:hypothetical protein [Methylibium sp.]